MIRVAVGDPNGTCLRIDFDPGESSVAALIAVASDMRAELVQRMMLHQLKSASCACDECRFTQQLQKRLDGFFVKGL